MKILIATMLFISASILAGDPAVAEALTKSGIDQESKGHYEQAESFFFKALANDDKCFLAMYELAKLYDRAGDKKLAICFYQRSLPGLDLVKKSDAMSKIKSINPYAVKLVELMDGYAKSLEDIVRKNPDRTTSEAIWNRVDEIELSNYVSATKLINIDKRNISRFVLNPVGKWLKSTGSVMTIKEDHTLEMDGVPGKWVVSGNTLSIDFSKFWGHVDCTINGTVDFSLDKASFTRVKK